MKRASSSAGRNSPGSSLTISAARERRDEGDLLAPPDQGRFRRDLMVDAGPDVRRGQAAMALGERSAQLRDRAAPGGQLEVDLPADRLPHPSEEEDLHDARIARSTLSMEVTPVSCIATRSSASTMSS